MGIWHLTKKFQFNLDTSKKQSTNCIPLLWHRLPSLWVCLHQPAQPSHTLVFSLAAIVHFGLLSPPCTFPGIQIIWRSAYRFFALSSTAGYLLSGLRQPSHPDRIFSGILPDSFYLLPARRLPAHVTLVPEITVFLNGKYSNTTYISKIWPESKKPRFPIKNPDKTEKPQI